LDTVNLAGKVYMVTGANNGLGKEVTKYLASKGCRVYMVCRSKERAEAARNDILSATNCAPANLRILNADCSLEADVRRAWAEFAAQEQTLDALVCNAGTLTHEKTFTPEGVEVTFAAHLLFGTYLLGSLALPTLERTPDSRVVVVSSGGMYNSAFPAWREATSTGIKAYDGQFAYAYGAWLLLFLFLLLWMSPSSSAVVKSHPLVVVVVVGVVRVRWQPSVARCSCASSGRSSFPVSSSSRATPGGRGPKASSRCVSRSWVGGS